MTEINDTHLVNALLVLTKCGVPPDIQELLIYGDPERKIAPGALNKMLQNFEENLLQEEHEED